MHTFTYRATRALLPRRLDWHLTRVPYDRKRHPFASWRSAIVGQYRELDVMFGSRHLLISVSRITR